MEAQSVGKRRRHLGEQAWRELFDRFDSAGLNVDAFCRREGLCRSSFNRWRARLRPEGRGVALPKRGTPTSSPSFVDLGMLGAATGSAAPMAAVPAGAEELRIELGGGITFTLSRR